MASTNKRCAIQRREEMIDQTEHMTQHMPKTGPSNSLKIKLDHMATIEALTPNQEKFFEIYKRGGYFTFLLGSPGVGKTMIAMAKAIEDVLDKSSTFKQLVVVRSTVSTRDQGFLPGTIEEKSEIYELPCASIDGVWMIGAPNVSTNSSRLMDGKKDGGFNQVIEQIADLEESLKRALADYQNLERRISSERTDLVKYANQELLKRLLPSFDNLYLAEKYIS